MIFLNGSDKNQEILKRRHTVHRTGTVDLTEVHRPDVERRGSLPIHVSTSKLAQLRRESRDYKRSRKKKSKKKKSKDRKVLSITIPHDDNEIVPISDDEEDGSDKVSATFNNFKKIN